MLSGTHALWAVERIWLDGSDVEPLGVGEAVDRFLHRTGLSGTRRQAISICVSENAPEATLRLLTARFGAVACGVAPADLIGADAPHERAPAKRG
jgi:hypothetical protein